MKKIKKPRLYMMLAPNPVPYIQYPNGYIEFWCDGSMNWIESSFSKYFNGNEKSLKAKPSLFKYVSKL